MFVVVLSCRFLKRLVSLFDVDRAAPVEVAAVGREGAAEWKRGKAERTCCTFSQEKNRPGLYRETHIHIYTQRFHRPE